MFKKKIMAYLNTLFDVLLLLSFAVTFALLAPRYTGDLFVHFEFPELDKNYPRVSAEEGKELIQYLDNSRPDADGQQKLIVDTKHISKLKALLMTSATPPRTAIKDQIILVQTSVQNVRIFGYFLFALLFIFSFWKLLTPKIMRLYLAGHFENLQAQTSLMELDLDSSGKDKLVIMEKLTNLHWHLRAAKRCVDELLLRPALFKNSEAKTFFTGLEKALSVVLRYFKNSHLGAVDPGSPLLKKLEAEKNKLLQRERELSSAQDQIPKEIEAGIASAIAKIDIENRESSLTAKRERGLLEKAQEERDKSKLELHELQLQVTERRSLAEAAEESASQMLRTAERLHNEAIQAKQDAEALLRENQSLVGRIDAGCQYLGQSGKIDALKLIELLRTPRT